MTRKRKRSNLMYTSATADLLKISKRACCVGARSSDRQLWLLLRLLLFTTCCGAHVWWHCHAYKVTASATPFIRELEAAHSCAVRGCGPPVSPKRWVWPDNITWVPHHGTGCCRAVGSKVCRRCTRYRDSRVLAKAARVWHAIAKQGPPHVNRVQRLAPAPIACVAWYSTQEPHHVSITPPPHHDSCCTTYLALGRVAVQLAQLWAASS